MQGAGATWEKVVNHKFSAYNLIFSFVILLPLSFINLTNHKKANYVQCKGNLQHLLKKKRNYRLAILKSAAECLVNNYSACHFLAMEETIWGA